LNIAMSIATALEMAISSASIWCARAVWTNFRQVKSGSARRERKAVSLIAIHSHNSASLLPRRCARPRSKPATLKGRQDWRDLPLVTIDPPDAKDHATRCMR
jgi:ribonuclease R